MRHIYKCTVLCGRTKFVTTNRSEGEPDPAHCVGECDCGNGLMVRQDGKRT